MAAFAAVAVVQPLHEVGFNLWKPEMSAAWWDPMVGLLSGKLSVHVPLFLKKESLHSRKGTLRHPSDLECSQLQFPM